MPPAPADNPGERIRAFPRACENAVAVPPKVRLGVAYGMCVDVLFECPSDLRPLIPQPEWYRPHFQVPFPNKNQEPNGWFNSCFRPSPPPNHPPSHPAAVGALSRDSRRQDACPRTYSSVPEVVLSSLALWNKNYYTL